MFVRSVLGAALVVSAMADQAAMAQEEARATLINPEGEEIGSVVFVETPHGIHLTAMAEGLPPGVHAFHIHAVGVCDAAEGFTTSGGHYAPRGRDHGFLVETGPHGGDFPNVHIQEDGVLAVEYVNAHLTLVEDAEGTLFDADGSAVVMHEGADDYTSQPSGAAGARIACGVVEKSE